jgi:hypothetical protein
VGFKPPICLTAFRLTGVRSNIDSAFLLVKPPEICGNSDGRDWFDERSFDRWIDSLSELGDLPTRHRLHCSKSGSPMTRFHFAS